MMGVFALLSRRRQERATGPRARRPALDADAVARGGAGPRGAAAVARTRVHVADDSRRCRDQTSARPIDSRNAAASTSTDRLDLCARVARADRRPGADESASGSRRIARAATWRFRSRSPIRRPTPTRRLAPPPAASPTTRFVGDDAIGVNTEPTRCWAPNRRRCSPRRTSSTTRGIAASSTGSTPPRVSASSCPRTC